jgi:hypothetical protein
MFTMRWELTRFGAMTTLQGRKFPFPMSLHAAWCNVKAKTAKRKQMSATSPKPKAFFAIDVA